MTTRRAELRALAGRSPLVTGLAAVVLLCGVIVGLLAATTDSPQSPGAAGQEEATEPSSAPRTAVAVSEPTTTIHADDVESAVRALPSSSEGTRLLVPAVGIDAPVVPVPLRAGGVLDPPVDVTHVGWWDGGARPGDEVGQTLLTGHSVHHGGGVMDDLELLSVGDVVRVTDDDEHVDYEVTEVVVWSKAELAANAVEAFGQDRHHGRLVLVTCEDWNGSDHDSNVVVFADPLTPT